MPPEVEHEVPTVARRELLTLRGHVEAVYYAGPTFSAGRLRTEAGDRVPFAGRVFVREGDPVVLRGRWGRHPKYGEQFEVEGVEFNQDLDVDGLARYLAGNPALKGIGPVKARAIAEKCGREFDRIITEEPETLARSAKMPLATIKLLREEWLRTKTLNSAATWLAGFGLTHHQITTLVDRLGNSVRAILEADPYMLVREVRGLGFKRVDKIARAMGTPKGHPGRIHAGIVHCVEEALDRGDTWVEHEDLIDRANVLLVMDELDAREKIERSLDGLVEEGTLSCISSGDRFLIARPDIERMERELAAIFLESDGPNPQFHSVKDVDSLVARLAPNLNDEQRAAVKTALGHSIALISGSAGSGKTYTVAAIVQICREVGRFAMLCAPTGKAAKRLEEVVDYPASTIHRLLGFNGSTYFHDSAHPLEADVLIVDEVSMVDVPLMHRLFQAIDRKRTGVVLVGDHHQLPPVGPGNILRDLIATRTLPTTVLNTVVRQAGVLKENSIAILHGEVRRTSEPDASGRRAWCVADQFSDQGAAARFVLDLFQNVLSERLGFDLLQDVMVLTPTHKGALGTIELNIALQRLVQRKLYGVDVPPPPPGRRARLLPRDRIIQTRNNYKLGVMNGAVGVVDRIEKDGGLSVSFEDQNVYVQPGTPDLRDLELAYALTVHKVQGSEFPCVVAIVHKAHAFQHHRNLLYTAVTRARKTVIVVGDAWGVRNCAKRRQVDERRTFLPFFLSGEIGMAK